MCGRFRLTRKDQEIREYFDVPDDFEWKPRYNIAPTENVAVVRQRRDHPSRTLSGMRWGLIPYWSKDAKGAARMINARSEEITEKPAYREAFQQRRCLVPADGFYEWKREGKSKQPFHLGMTDDSLFAFAGIWERWKNPAGEIIKSCAILTTTPNNLLSGIHDRMPVILSPDDYEEWLNPAADIEVLKPMLKPYSSRTMRMYSVSTAVNRAGYDAPDCIAPVREPQQLRL